MESVKALVFPLTTSPEYTIIYFSIQVSLKMDIDRRKWRAATQIPVFLIFSILFLLSKGECCVVSSNTICKRRFFSCVFVS